MSGDTKTGYTALADASSGTGLVAVAETVPPAVTVTERVEVIAPANLPGDYELHCDFLGRPVVVRVVRICGSRARVCAYAFVFARINRDFYKIGLVLPIDSHLALTTLHSRLFLPV
jgi:hypothetical protein